MNFESLRRGSSSYQQPCDFEPGCYGAGIQYCQARSSLTDNCRQNSFNFNVIFSLCYSEQLPAGTTHASIILVMRKGGRLMCNSNLRVALMLREGELQGPAHTYTERARPGNLPAHFHCNSGRTDCKSLSGSHLVANLPSMPFSNCLAAAAAWNQADLLRQDTLRRARLGHTSVRFALWFLFQGL